MFGKEFAKEKILDDLARMAGGTVQALGGLSKQVQDEIRIRVNEMGTRLNFVPREDFEKLEAMIVAAREDQAKQNARIEALEKQLASKAAKTK